METPLSYATVKQRPLEIETEVKGDSVALRRRRPRAFLKKKEAGALFVKDEIKYETNGNVGMH